MSAVHLWQFPVPDDAIDALGHVNNLAYLGWMQDVAIAHSEIQGWPMARYLERRQSWVVLSHAIRYLRPAFAGEDIAIATWISDFHPLQSRRRYAFLRKSDGKQLADAETNWAYVDLRSGRPMAVPADVRDAFQIERDDRRAIAEARRAFQPAPE